MSGGRTIVPFSFSQAVCGSWAIFGNSWDEHKTWVVLSESAMDKGTVPTMGKKEEKLWDKEVKSEDMLWQVEEYQAQGKRPSMEDASVVLKNFGDTKSNLFCAVFDGHYGSRYTGQFLYSLSLVTLGVLFCPVVYV